MKKNKVKDMIRSVLPSSARKGARDDKAAANRKNRHRVKQTLHTFGGPDAPEDEDDPNESECISRIHESDKMFSRNIRSVMHYRRNHDKISHFVRWCEEITKHLPDDPKEKYYFVAGKIGGSTDVIRKHALGHFIDPEWDFNKEQGSVYLYRSPPPPIVFEKSVFRTALQEAWETSHKALNRLLKDTPLFFKKCRVADDSCMEIKEVTKVNYNWVPQSKTSYYRSRINSSYKPKEKEYIAGTLSKTVITKDEEYHDVDLCRHRLLINKQEDVERLMLYLFGTDKGYQDYKVNWRSGHNALIKTLCKFFLNKGMMANYLNL